MGESRSVRKRVKGTKKMTIQFINEKGEQKEYGALTTFSRYSDKDWLTIRTALVKRDNPELFETIKNNEAAIHAVGDCIDLAERYEALLETLPQSSYSKAGTHPIWIADAVEYNVFHKYMTQDDIKAILEDKDYSSEEKLEEIKKYLEIGADEK